MNDLDYYLSVSGFWSTLFLKAEPDDDDETLKRIKDFSVDSQIFSVLKVFCTCVFLRPHRSIDDPLKGSYPISLLRLRLTGEQELPVRRDDGDAVVPVVALRGRGQP